MKCQETKQAKFIRPFFTEKKAKEIVETPKRFALKKKQIEWVSSIPLYIPFWIVQVEMTLNDPKVRTKVKKVYTTITNGITNRGMLVRGELFYDNKEQQGIFFDNETEYQKIAETARLEALSNTKRMINPPPHRVLPGGHLVYYPLALVHVKVNGVDDVQVFDYYRGGIDKYMMRYLNLKDKMEEKKRQKAVNA
ncbi:MAG: hypothetical protein PHN35_05670 [Clostridia bacterium]|nr:hypothetical protein [Clostridia bacterium]